LNEHKTFVHNQQGRRLRGDRWITPLKKLDGGTEVLLSPNIYKMSGRFTM